MKKILSVDKLETKEILLILQSILLGASITGRGVLWFTSTETILKDLPFYLVLNLHLCRRFNLVDILLRYDERRVVQ